MKVVRDEIQLCDDCLVAAVGDDVTGIDSEDRVTEVWAGLERLGPNLVADFDSNTGRGIREFSSLPCGCCGSRLAGSRHEFAILGDGK